MKKMSMLQMDNGTFHIDDTTVDLSHISVLGKCDRVMIFVPLLFPVEYKPAPEDPSNVAERKDLATSTSLRGKCSPRTQ